MHFVGDTHGIGTFLRIMEKKRWENQNIIHVGDFGLGFVEITRDINNLLAMDEALTESGNHLYVIRGNHDNPIFWDKSKGLNIPRLHNLHLVEDFTMINIEGKNVLFAGGAISIDRRPRMDEIPWPSWWKDEVFRYDEDKLESALYGTTGPDIVVTHSAPDFCHPVSADNYLVNNYHAIEMAHGFNLHEELAAERAEFTRFYNDLVMNYEYKPRFWFYGHFHSTKEQRRNGTLFKLLNINETYEVN